MCLLQREHALSQQPSQPIAQAPPSLQGSQATESGEADVRDVTRRLRRVEINPDEPPTLYRGCSGQEWVILVLPVFVLHAPR